MNRAMMHAESPARRLVALPTLLVLLSLGAAIEAAEPAAAQLPVAARDEVAKLIAALDATEFADRQRAAEGLAQWAKKPELAAALAAEFQRTLLLPSTSFEVRRQLQDLLKDLPDVAVPPATEVDSAEIDHLIELLGDDTYSVRQGALQRLQWLATSPPLACSMTVRLKLRLADPALAGELRRQIKPTWEQARATWLSLDPARWQLPEVPDDQIGRWIDNLVEAGTSHAARVHRGSASRELIDLLARDDYKQRTAALLEKRLGTLNDDAAKKRLQRVYDWTRPAIVNEYWSNHHHGGIQHLLVDVPQYPEGSQRASHFDRIDDLAAHCVSGNNLEPGTYPVGVAIAHPMQHSAFFHIVNLPTPRRRLAYQYEVRRSEAQRLKEISQRTLDRVMRDKRHLTADEIMMLDQLDAGCVSQFVAGYFQTIADQELDDSGPLGGQRTEHAAICFALGAMATHEALPALEKLARGAPGKPPEAPLAQIAWSAALAIADRNPPKDVDQWLSTLVVETLPLVSDVEHPPELGATAAGLLVTRQNLSPADFGLEIHSGKILQRFGVDGYRFTSEQKRKALINWSKQRRPTGT